MRKHIMLSRRQTWVAAADRGSHEPDQSRILPGASCGTERYRSSAGEVLHRAIMGHIVHPASTAFLAFVLRVSGTRKSVHGSVSAPLTSVMLGEPGADPLRVLQELVGAVLDAC